MFDGGHLPWSTNICINNLTMLKRCASHTVSYWFTITCYRIVTGSVRATMMPETERLQLRDSQCRTQVSKGLAIWARDLAATDDD